MAHPHLTPFESELLRAVEELNTTFETGLKQARASPDEFETLHRAFNRFAADLERRLTALERQHSALVKQLRS